MIETIEAKDTGKVMKSIETSDSPKLLADDRRPLFKSLALLPRSVTWESSLPLSAILICSLPCPAMLPSLWWWCGCCVISCHVNTGRDDVTEVMTPQEVISYYVFKRRYSQFQMHMKWWRHRSQITWCCPSEHQSQRQRWRNSCFAVMFFSGPLLEPGHDVITMATYCCASVETAIQLYSVCKTDKVSNHWPSQYLWTTVIMN